MPRNKEYLLEQFLKINTGQLLALLQKIGGREAMLSILQNKTDPSVLLRLFPLGTMPKDIQKRWESEPEKFWELLKVLTKPKNLPRFKTSFEVNVGGDTRKTIIASMMESYKHTSNGETLYSSNSPTSSMQYYSRSAWQNCFEVFKKKETLKIVVLDCDDLGIQCLRDLNLEYMQTLHHRYGIKPCPQSLAPILASMKGIKENQQWSKHGQPYVVISKPFLLAERFREKRNCMFGVKRSYIAEAGISSSLVSKDFTDFSLLVWFSDVKATNKLKAKLLFVSE